MIEELTIIIPTWNSMPELERCLNSIQRVFPENIVKEIIVIDKHSTDNTDEFARQHGCKVLYDDKTLGSARLKGLKEAKTEWIAFIDSDIELPEGWFEKMLTYISKVEDSLKYNTSITKKCFKCKYLSDCWVDFENGIYNTEKMKKLCPETYRIVSHDIGWIYGRTIDDREPIRSEKLWKMNLELGKNGYRLIKEGQRAYTNNTLCLRKPLLNAKIEHLNAWEDYVLTQEMLKAGYAVVEVPVTCTHLRSHTYSKFGVMTEAWGIAGELKAKGINPYTLLRPFWFLYWGLRCTFHFKDLQHFKFNLQVFFSMIKAIFHRKEAFSWKR
ncbi:MAG: glycosyltransferase family 2 protein [Thermoplasmata archaeon]|nr:glycosyltransferase family 2 protein [Thermoplasmata archaeon]